MNYNENPDGVAEILSQFILLEQSKDWLEEQITSKIRQIDIAEEDGLPEDKVDVMYKQLHTLYHRCSFEKKEMDRFIAKYGHAIPTGKS